MSRPRKDTPKELSRQRLFQKKRSAQGLCELCGGVLDDTYSGRCTPCMKKQVDRNRPPAYQPWKPGSVGRVPLWYKNATEQAKKDISDSVGQ